MHPAQRAPALLALQRTQGNRYVQRVVTGIQAKLKIGQPGDKYEQEADRVAEQVVRMPEWRVQRQEEEKEEHLIRSKPLVDQNTPLVQRQVEEEEEEKEILQTKRGEDTTPEVIQDFKSRIHTLQGRGQPLPESVRTFFEPRFGYDFGRVRVHTDAQLAETAKTVNARAFTIGQDVVFGTGQYSPQTWEGKRLLAHELTHVIQQAQQPQQSKGMIQRDVTMPEETITVSEQRREQILRGAGWRQSNVSVAVTDFRGLPMRGYMLFAEFRSGDTQNTEGGSITGGAVHFPNVWLQPNGTIRFIAVRMGTPGLAPEVVTHYNRPSRGPLRFQLVQQHREIVVTATDSEQAARTAGVQGTMGVDFEVVSLGAQLSEERTRTTGRSVTVQWKVIVPTEAFRATQVA